MAGRLNAIVVAPMGMHKPSGAHDDEPKDEYKADEEGGSDEECRAAFDDFADAIDLPEDKRDHAYDALHRYFSVEFMKAESEPHEEAGEKEEG